MQVRIESPKDIVYNGALEIIKMCSSAHEAFHSTTPAYDPLHFPPPPAAPRPRGPRPRQHTRLGPHAALRAALQAAAAPQPPLSPDEPPTQQPTGDVDADSQMPLEPVQPQVQQPCSETSLPPPAIDQPPCSMLSAPGHISNDEDGGAVSHGASNASRRMQTPVPPTTTMLGRNGSTAQVLVVHASSAFAQGSTGPRNDAWAPLAEPLAAHASGLQGAVDEWLASRVASAASSVAREPLIGGDRLSPTLTGGDRLSPTLIGGDRLSPTARGSSVGGAVDEWLASRVASAANSVVRRTPLLPLTQQSLPSAHACGSVLRASPSSTAPPSPQLPPLTLVEEPVTHHSAPQADNGAAMHDACPRHDDELVSSTTQRATTQDVDTLGALFGPTPPTYSSRASSAARQAAAEAVLQTLVDSAAHPSPMASTTGEPLPPLTSAVSTTSSTVSGTSSSAVTITLDASTSSSNGSSSVSAAALSGLPRTGSLGGGGACPAPGIHTTTSAAASAVAPALSDGASTPVRPPSSSSSAWSVHAAAAAAVLADVVEGLSGCSSPWECKDHETVAAGTQWVAGLQGARVATPDTPGGEAARAVLEGLLATVAAEHS